MICTRSLTNSCWAEAKLKGERPGWRHKSVDRILLILGLAWRFPGLVCVLRQRTRCSDLTSFFIRGLQSGSGEVASEGGSNSSHEQQQEGSSDCRSQIGATAAAAATPTAGGAAATGAAPGTKSQNSSRSQNEDRGEQQNGEPEQHSSRSRSQRSGRRRRQQ